MKIQQNVTVFVGDTRNNVQADKAGNDRAANEKSKTFYAGNLLSEFPLKDRIQQKKARAQERAMKIVGDAWDGSRKIDEQIQQSKDHLREQQEIYNNARNRIKEIGEESNALMEYYEVDADSEEQQDLELLKKAQAEKYPWIGIQLTMEEEAKLAEIEGKELTVYQKRQLELNEAAWIYRDKEHWSELEIETENAVIRGIRLERLKKEPMLKAQQQAENVMDAARDEIMSMVVEEAKGHIDEEQEKREEESEAIKEKKEEQEKILEERREREEELEQLMEDMPMGELVDMNQTLAEVKRQVQNIVNEMSLVAEDIKGSKVDANI